MYDIWKKEKRRGEKKKKEFDGLLTKLHDNFPKIIGMTTPLEESDITKFPLISGITPKAKFLYIPNSFEYKTQNKQDDSSNIPSSPEIW